MKSTPLIEHLESRIAPASVYSFTEPNHDVVKISSSFGDLAGRIGVTTAPDNAHFIFSLNLADLGFNHTNITATVTKKAGGDGQLIVGHIGAGSNDLGSVRIAGDLGDIDAGSGSLTVAAIKSLKVGSYGRFGQFGTGDYVSTVNGNLPSVTVKGDLVGADVRVSKALGTVTIGGSILGGDADYSGRVDGYEVGKVSVGHDIVGGKGLYTGGVGAAHSITSVTVGGSLVGSFGANSGNIYSSVLVDGKIGTVTIKGSLQGGAGAFSGEIGAHDYHADKSVTTHAVELGTVTIGRDLVGGGGDYSAEIWAYGGKLAKATVHGSVYGGSGLFSGNIDGSLATGTIAVGGSLYGSTGGGSGSITCGGEVKVITVGHSLFGGNSAESASIIMDTGKLGLLKIGGDLRGSTGAGSAAVIVKSGITAFTIGGSQIPGSGTNSGKIN